ncbi:MAG: hypothetical protein AB2A00_36670 [Myxococcota bacterium]
MLGALLLRTGVLDKDVLAAALDRQVVYGGTLDTAVLEMGVLDEPAMAELLARWTGYPVCPPGALESADPAALAALPGALASRFLVTPFALTPEGLWLATTAPVDVDSLAQLGGLIDRPVLPHVTTELRIRTALAQAYGVALDPRFQELASYLTARAAALAAQAAPPPQEAPPADSVASAVEQSGGSREVIFPAAPRPEPEPAPADEDQARPIDFAEALAHLAAATDRDGIVQLTVRYALQTFPFVAVLGVLRGQAVVWAARGHKGEKPEQPEQLKGTTISLQEPSTLRTVVETRAPSLGRPSTGPAGTTLSERLGRGVPRACLMVPVLVGGRVVAVVYADHGEWAIRTQQASEILAFASRVGPAFEHIIRERRAKTLNPPAPPPPPPPPPPEELAPLAIAEAAVSTLAATQQAEPERWVVGGPAANTLSVPSAEATSSPPVEQWVVRGPGESAPPVEAPPPAPPPPPAPADEEEDEEEEAATPGEESILVEPEPTEASAPSSDQPTETLEVDTGVATGEEVTVAMDEPGGEPAALAPPAPPTPEPTPMGPAAAWGEPPATSEPAVPVEAPPPAAPRPALSPNVSPEAAALAAAALARLQAGDDDDDEDEEEGASAKETSIAEDTTWAAAMVDVLGSGKGRAPAESDGSFKTSDDANTAWQSSLAQAAKDAGTLEKPVYQPLPEDDDEEEESPKPGEESVVFAEVADNAAAGTQAFTKALSDTIESGKQGGEADKDYKAFAQPPTTTDDDDDEDEEPDNVGWESVVYQAAEQVRAEEEKSKAAKVPNGSAPNPFAVEAVPQTSSTPPPLPADAATSTGVLPPPPPKTTRSQPPPVEEPALIDPPKVWVEALMSGVADRVVVAIQKLAELGEAAVPALTAAFPGRVTFDPFGPDPNPPDAASVSPLMDVLCKMGGTGLQVAITHLDSKFPAHRYFATLLLCRGYQPAVIPYLLRRLHDDEPRIRRLSADGLAMYVADPGFDQVLRHLRTRVTSLVPEARRRAIHFLGRFRDVGSIPALVNALRAKEPEIVQEAGLALHAITLQSYGTSERKWINWWEKNKHRSRIEWLIDALRDSDVEVRARAGAELAQLPRDTFGFRADAPKRDREEAVKRWEKWWADERRRLAPGAGS